MGGASAKVDAVPLDEPRELPRRQHIVDIRETVLTELCAAPRISSPVAAMETVTIDSGAIPIFAA